jgi:hypothetical protein
MRSSVRLNDAEHDRYRAARRFIVHTADSAHDGDARSGCAFAAQPVHSLCGRWERHDDGEKDREDTTRRCPERGIANTRLF